MPPEKKTLGQAIDQIIAALEALDESSRATAISAACAHVGLDRQMTQHQKAVVPLQSAAQVVPAERSVSRTIDIRLLKDEKKPDSALEMACVVAYYLQEHAPAAERKDVVTIDDMKKYFKQAAFPLPKRIEQLLVNARHAGYFDLADRGDYRLNAVGYNLAAHSLPRTPKPGD